MYVYVLIYVCFLLFVLLLHVSWYSFEVFSSNRAVSNTLHSLSFELLGKVLTSPKVVFWGSGRLAGRSAAVGGGGLQAVGRAGARAGGPY